MWRERPRLLRACEWCCVLRYHVLRYWCAAAIAWGCNAFCNLCGSQGPRSSVYRVVADAAARPVAARTTTAGMLCAGWAAWSGQLYAEARTHFIAFFTTCLNTSY